MTKEEASKWADLYKAYADGKTIQFNDEYSGWVDRLVAYFDSSVEDYRVKTEMKKSAGYREFFCKIGNDIYLSVAWEGHDSPSDIEGKGFFLRWIHPTWQYAEYEDET